MPADGSKRVSSEQWLRKALELFASTGEGGLRVDNLAKALNISKSGFYYHFKDRDDFLQKLFVFWAHEYTEVVTKNAVLNMTPARDRLLLIATLVFEQNLTEFDSAMHVWANKDPAIAKKVRRVTDMRLAYTGKAFAELGFEGDDLEMRTRLFLAYMTVERQLYGPSKQTAERYRQRRIDLLLSGMPDPADGG